jgi:2-keto-4-pentenoate hydratase/2-oxohepta-3-ene-1,7-dioic acid hydratase in catechol pathway
MQIVRVAYRNMSFYARIEDGKLHCLDPAKNISEPIPIEEAALLPLAVPTKVIGVGLNYKDHSAETGMPMPEEPLIFFKPPSAIVGFRDPIVIPAGVGRVDYEGELVAVMGRKCRDITEEEARTAVFGWTCGNDVTARDLQKKDGLFARAKGFDTFAPVGPWIETDTPEPGDLELKTWVNGQLRQHGFTRDMAFSPLYLISFISRIMTLMPGDLIFTGTPAGIGPLAPGDEVTVEIDGVGKLVNPVLAEADLPDEDEAPEPLQ